MKPATVAWIWNRVGGRVMAGVGIAAAGPGVEGVGGGGGQKQATVGRQLQRGQLAPSSRTTGE